MKSKVSHLIYLSVGIIVAVVIINKICLCFKLDFISTVNAVSTVFIAIFAGAQYWKNVTQDRRDRDTRLRQSLTAILALSVQYPYLEHTSITNKWNAWKKRAGKNEEKYDAKFARYDQFADLIFNFLEDVYNSYDKNKEEIEKFIDVKDWVLLHKQIWQEAQTSNDNRQNAYSKEFCDFINSYLDNAHEEENNHH